ncbi:MAG: hypothetical protein ABI611_07375 [Solirubrobacteraceae bacterium]
MLVTVGALFALAVVIAVGPNGPARLWLDGGGNSVSLKPRVSTTSAATLPGSPVGLLAGAPTSGLAGGVSLASPVTAAQRPGAVQLRANTRVQRRSAARTPSASRPSRPSRPAPASTPTTLQPVSQSTATARAPVATPAPGSTVVKSRGRGTTPARTEVPKQRVNKEATPAPTPAPGPSATPGATPRSAATPAPATEMRPVHAGGQPSTGVGAAVGVLQRVPPTHP